MDTLRRYIHARRDQLARHGSYAAYIELSLLLRRLDAGEFDEAEVTPIGEFEAAALQMRQNVQRLYKAAPAPRKAVRSEGQ